MKIKKPLENLWSLFGAAILLLALHSGTNNGAAQPIVPDSIVQITAEAQGLPLVPPDQIPPFGTFWLASPGFCRGLPPLPCPPDDPSLPVYAIADGQFLVDATGGGQVALTETVLLAEVDALVNLITQIQVTEARRHLRAMGLNFPLPGDGGSDNGGDDYSPAYRPLVIDTNRLWLEIIAVTNQTASLVIHPPTGVSNQVYELLYSTNLSLPRTNWQWVLRSDPNETNLIVPNARDTQGFYQLRSPGDLVANDSLGTNFWLAFCGLASDSQNVLSFFISSPMGATGTVFTPGLWTNSPILVVTNCGDTELNGIYVQTPLTPLEKSAWGNHQLQSTDASYVRGTNWVVIDVGWCYLIGYNSATSDINFWYEKTGTDPNGTTNDWGANPAQDTNSPPATVCPQVHLVDQSFTVEAGTLTNINIPLAAMMVDYDVIATNGIIITASQPVSVYGFDYAPYASAAFTGYPTTLLGTNYCVMARAASYPSTSPGFAASEFSIVATASNTTVTITPFPTANLAGSIWTTPFTMQPGETYQIYSQDRLHDVTGTLIKSDKPIAVFAGANIAFVPDTSTESGNPLVQEQLPVESWGKEVLALSFAGRTNGDSYRVLAAYSNTVITITGKVVTVVDETSGPPWTVTTSNRVVNATITNAGEFYEIIVDGPVEFQASRPIQVAQFANGLNFDYIQNPDSADQEGDPCEVLLPPISHCFQTNIVSTGPGLDFSVSPTAGFNVHYLNIIVVHSAITNTLVNSVPIAATNFAAIGSSGYCGTQIAVTNGVYKVTSSQPVQVQVYGFGGADAYSYFGGVVK